MNSNRRAEIQARVEKATAGPWEGVSVEYVRTRQGMTLGWGDAEFLTHAREDIPYLLAELAAAEAERDRLREYARHAARCEKWDRDYYGNEIEEHDDKPCTCGLADLLARKDGTR